MLPPMTTLADVRSRVRTELGETAGGEAWADDELDRHIQRALEDLSIAWPREQKATVATTAGSRDLSLSGLSGLVEVEAVEYPVGLYPPASIGFGRWNATLTLHVDTLPAGEDAAVYYTARHTLDGSGTTLDAFQLELLAAGASAYAALERSASLSNQLVTAGDSPERFAAYARARLTAFRQLLQQYGRKNAVRGRRLYVPA
jgi:hypothetical protein